MEITKKLNRRFKERKSCLEVTRRCKKGLIALKVCSTATQRIYGAEFPSRENRVAMLRVASLNKVRVAATRRLRVFARVLK